MDKISFAKVDDMYVLIVEAGPSQYCLALTEDQVRGLANGMLKALDLPALSASDDEEDDELPN